jgi:hypothetical protein
VDQDLDVNLDLDLDADLHLSETLQESIEIACGRGAVEGFHNRQSKTAKPCKTGSFNKPYQSVSCS